MWSEERGRRTQIAVHVTVLSYRVFDLYYLCVFGLRAISLGLMLLSNFWVITQEDQEHLSCFSAFSLLSRLVV